MSLHDERGKTVANNINISIDLSDELIDKLGDALGIEFDNQTETERVMGEFHAEDYDDDDDEREPTDEELREIDIENAIEALRATVGIWKLKLQGSDICTLKDQANDAAYLTNDLMMQILVGRNGNITLDPEEVVYLGALFDTLTLLGYIQHEYTLNLTETLDIFRVSMMDI